MTKKFFSPPVVMLIMVMFLCQKSNAQKEGDSKIVITVADTQNLFVRLKDLMIRANFYVKDLSIRDSILTYPTEFHGVYVVAIAAIKENTIMLSGTYGLKKIDDWGYTSSPRNFDKIIYYKGNREWRILREIAESLGGVISYEK